MGWIDDGRYAAASDPDRGSVTPATGRSLGEGWPLSTMAARNHVTVWRMPSSKPTAGS